MLDSLAVCRGASRAEGVAIVRLDAIGDYILFRNFLAAVRAANRFRDRTITLIGNSAWKELGNELDVPYVDEFIWINPSRFARNPFYRLKTLRRLGSAYSIAINPAYSRDLLAQDMLVKKINAGIKIGQVANDSNRFSWHQKYSDSIYSELIDTGRDLVFEFYRNKKFFEAMLGTHLDIHKPKLSLPKDYSVVKLPAEFVVFFVGANHPKRRWAPGHFAELAGLIHKKYNLSVVLCGGPGDSTQADRFLETFETDTSNLVGKTTLLQLAWILKHSKLVVSNETSAAHIAVAVNARSVVVLSNGNHFGRFTPYPEEMNVSYFPVYHQLLEARMNLIQGNKEFVSDLDVSEIEVERVWEQVQRCLTEDREDTF